MTESKLHCIRLPKDQSDRLTALANSSGTKRNRLIREAIDLLLQQKGVIANLIKEASQKGAEAS